MITPDDSVSVSKTSSSTSYGTAYWEARYEAPPPSTPSDESTPTRCINALRGACAEMDDSTPRPGDSERVRAALLAAKAKADAEAGVVKQELTEEKVDRPRPSEEDDGSRVARKLLFESAPCKQEVGSEAETLPPPSTQRVTQHVNLSPRESVSDWYDEAGQSKTKTDNVIYELTEAQPTYPNPHAAFLLGEKACTLTRDELALYKGVESAHSPQQTTFSRNFSGRNLATVYTLYDDLAVYYGERWPGVGQNLFVRVTQHMWSFIAQHRLHRSEQDRLRHKLSFRSESFPYSFFELQLLETWLSHLLTILPAWLRGFILQDIKNMLDIEDKDDLCCGGSDVGSEGSLGGVDMTSQSYLRYKAKSNFYCYDGIWILFLLRLYSGHGVERQQILNDAKNLNLMQGSHYPTVSEVERRLAAFHAEFRALAKFDIRIEEPVLVWNVVYEQILKVCTHRQEREWELFRTWFNGYILERNMHNIQPGEADRIFKCINEARSQMKNIMLTSGVSSMNADGFHGRGRRDHQYEQQQKDAQMAQLQPGPSGGQGHPLQPASGDKDRIIGDQVAVKMRRLDFVILHQLSPQAPGGINICYSWVKGNGTCRFGDACKYKSAHVEITQAMKTALVKRENEAVKQYPDDPRYADRRTEFRNVVNQAFSDAVRNQQQSPPGKGGFPRPPGKGGKGGKGKKGKGGKETEHRQVLFGDLESLDEDPEDEALLQKLDVTQSDLTPLADAEAENVQNAFSVEEFDTQENCDFGMLNFPQWCSNRYNKLIPNRSEPDYEILSWGVARPPTCLIRPAPVFVGDDGYRYKTWDPVWEYYISETSLTADFIDSDEFGFCRWEQVDLHALRDLGTMWGKLYDATPDLQCWQFQSRQGFTVFTTFRRPHQVRGFGRLRVNALLSPDAHFGNMAAANQRWIELDRSYGITDFYSPSTPTEKMVRVGLYTPTAVHSYPPSSYTPTPASAPLLSDSHATRGSGSSSVRAHSSSNSQADSRFRTPAAPRFSSNSRSLSPLHHPINELSEDSVSSDDAVLPAHDQPAANFVGAVGGWLELTHAWMVWASPVPVCVSYCLISMWIFAFLFMGMTSTHAFWGFHASVGMFRLMWSADAVGWSFLRFLVAAYVLLFVCNPLAGVKIAVAFLTLGLLPVVRYFRMPKLIVYFEAINFMLAGLVQYLTSAETADQFQQSLSFEQIAMNHSVTFYQTGDRAYGYRTCLDTGAARNLIRPESSFLHGDRPCNAISMNLAGGKKDRGILYTSGEVRRQMLEGDRPFSYDQLISVGRLVRRGATFNYSRTDCTINLPTGKRIVALVADDCPYIESLSDVDVLREFMREDVVREAHLSTSLQCVVDSACDCVDFSQIGISELEALWDASHHKPRSFLSSFVKADTDPAGGEENFSLCSLQIVDKRKLLAKLRSAGPILVKHNASNLQRAPHKQSKVPEDTIYAPPAGYDTLVHCDLHTVSGRVVRWLDPRFYVHAYLMQDTESNRLLQDGEQTQLRSLVNTLAYATGTRPELSVPLQTVARGQAKGRLRHLEGARRIASYAHHHRDRGYRHFLDHDHLDSGLEDLSIFLLGDWDSSLGNAGPLVEGEDKQTKVRLDGDGFARMGIVLKVFVGPTTASIAEADSRALVFHSRSSLNSTVSVSTCEAELTSCTWISREVVACKRFLTEALPWISIRRPAVFGDNNSANLIGSGQASLRAVRHLSLQRLFVRCLTREGELHIREKRSEKNCSDLMTKMLSEVQVVRLLGLMGNAKL